MINRLLVAVAIILCIVSAYFFFIERHISWGSITLLASVFFSIAFAMSGSVNKLPDDKTPLE